MTTTGQISTEDLDQIAHQLKEAFDVVASIADRKSAEFKIPHYEKMTQIAEALVKVSAEARACRESNSFTLCGK